MKKHKKMKELLAIALFTFICIGCNHDIPAPSEEATPFAVTIQPSDHIQTRVNENHFEKQDSIGLFILKQPNTLAEERHADNQRYTFDGSNWNCNTQIYYPNNTELCDFIAYYPYRAEALAPGETNLACIVAPDQSNPQNFTQSDLLVAERIGVTPSPEPVTLVFKHKLAEVCIELEYGTGFGSAEELLASNPTVAILGAALEGNYDLQNRQVTNHSNKGSIIPAGTFHISGDKLIGKQAILLPQTLPGNQPFIEVLCGGRKFIFTFGENHTIAPATRETYTLTLQRAALQTNIKTEISDWESESAIDGQLIEEDINITPTSGNYRFTLPDFSESHVYQATFPDGSGIEVCKEFLRADRFEAQAIVAYPISRGKTDLKKGIALQLNETGSDNARPGMIHGGTVEWDVEKNSLNYVGGTANIQTHYYYTPQEGITHSAFEGAELLALKPICIDDSRSEKNYPIVKVGTQYWMKSNLKATQTQSGAELTNATTNSAWTKAINQKEAAYAINKNIYYYTHEATKSDILPNGWKIPHENDWTKLLNYVGKADYVTEWGSNASMLSISHTFYRKKDGTYSTGTNTGYYWHNSGNISFYSAYNITYLINEGACIRGIRQ